LAYPDVLSAFSDTNWVSMGPTGANYIVYATVVDGAGNLYVGGQFRNIGDVFASAIAKWDGNRWTALGSGLNSEVDAIAVSGDDVYAGGGFKGAGGKMAIAIAKWNGSSWSAL